ncbi:olfactory receptor 18-like [Suncus etruscus]|uniref:olfactory receptor 18-like n=1 Tax=Suncus etruscus TaxID=109475 RepID=UPI00210F3667|nr:olfactory receptor 18-like [Suncus etruscus]
MDTTRCLCNLGSRNLTGIVEFLLLGLSDDPAQQPLLLGAFLAMYLVTAMGNLLIVLAVSSDPHLHTPMYFFLSVLSVTDVGYSSTTVLRMIWGLQTHHRDIPYRSCLAQVSLFNLFACLDSVVLAVMAYDRFVAICHPLHYPVIMNPRLCIRLVLLSFSVSLIESQLNFLVISRLPFCSHVEIPHFFCDLPQLLKLACDATSTNSVLMYFVAAVFAGLPVSGIIFSYTQIVSSVLRVPSAGGRYKAFSTCASHLTVVCLFYGTGLGVYFSSTISPCSRKGAVASVMYTVVTPMLNPFIYCLRNRDIKQALQRLFKRAV